MIRDEVLTAEEVEGKSNTELLSKHILELQADKGRLTDKVKELEQQIEKMKCCENCRYCNKWGEANGNSPNCKKCNWVSNWKLRR